METPLSVLGSRTPIPTEPSGDILEAFDNLRPNSSYIITLDCPEFTSMCPVTGQPDFGRWVIDYCADKLCVESKSLKLYLGSFRNQGCFWEDISNRIAGDLFDVMAPKWLRLTGYMASRGGIGITTTVVLGDTKLAGEMLKLVTQRDTVA
ncbi:MAG: preQ(1) synthase [bacterium]|nr:preQ(1) synthase [bacterium]